MDFGSVLLSSNFLTAGVVVYLTIGLRMALKCFSNIIVVASVEKEMEEIRYNIFCQIYYLIYSLILGMILPLVALVKLSILNEFWNFDSERMAIAARDTDE